MSIQIDVNMPIFTQKEIVRETGIASKTIDNYLDRLHKLAPKLKLWSPNGDVANPLEIGTRSGKGERRLFSRADVRTFKIIHRVAYFIGEQEAAKTAMALHPRIAGIVDFKLEDCMIVEPNNGEDPPSKVDWYSEKFEFPRYPPERIIDVALVVPYGRLLAEADAECAQMYNSRKDRSNPNPEPAGE